MGNYYATHCLAYSLLQEEKFTVSEIGDVNTALSAEILNCLSPEPVYTGDVHQIDLEKGEVKVVSDGNCPPSLAGKVYPAEICEHGFESEGAAGGLSVCLVCKPGPVTIAHLCRVYGEFHMHIATGNAYEPPKNKIRKRMEECGLPHWPHGFIKLDGDPDRYVQNQRGEFTSLAYGNYVDEIVELCTLLDIKPLVS